MKKFPLYLSAAALAASLLLPGCSGPTEYCGGTSAFFAMDTFMDLTAYGDRGQEAVDQIQESIHSLESELSRTCETSAVYKLNHVPGIRVDFTKDLRSILSLSKEYSALLDGTFDITVTSAEDLWGFASDSFRVPTDAEITRELDHIGQEHIRSDARHLWLDPGTKIDFGGIAKGYAADQALDILNDCGIEHGLANLGGDLLAKGGRPDGSPWRIAIQDPLSPSDQSQYIGIVQIQDAYMLTSGNYQRYFEEGGSKYHHIIDPRTGRPSQSGLASVTIISSTDDCSGALCDALATSLFIMGTDGALDFWRNSSLSFDFVLVTQGGKVFITDGLRDCFTPNKDAPYTFTFVS